MKRQFITLSLTLLVCVLAGLPALAQDPPAPAPPVTPKPGKAPKAPKPPVTPKPGRAPVAPVPPVIWGDNHDDEVSRAKTPAASNVVVRLSLSQGDIIVRGWSKNEVEAEAEGQGRVRLERSDDSAADTPATQINVHLRHQHEDDEDNDNELAHSDDLNDDCSADHADHVTLNVPQGATLYLKTSNGDIHVTQVAEADAQTSNGDLRLVSITRAVRGVTPNGDIDLTDATGRIELRALSGDISVLNVRPGEVGDYLRAISASGDIFLDKVAHGNVEATTVSNEILFQGALARGGNYTFRTTSGDITLIIPAESSFRLNARVSYGDISTDFACRSEGDGQSANDLKKGRLTGICGKGEANLTLSTFNGSIALRKR